VLTSPQKSLHGRQIAWPRGRVLGGSSAINFLQITFPSAAEIDAWGALGNQGWSWKDLEPYYRRSQRFIKPSDDLSALLGTSHYTPSNYGDSGPITVSFYKASSELNRAWLEAFELREHRMDSDPLSGDAMGGFTNLASVDPESVTRCYSTNAYYLPSSARQNLFVLTEACAQKIQFEPSQLAMGKLTADRVSFIHGGRELVVTARREVILCAGTIQSPQILELSGIGSRYILESCDIPVLIENPNVGENLQDHALLPLCYEVADTRASLDALRDPGVLSQAVSEYASNKTGPFATGVVASAFVPLTPLLSGSVKIDVRKALSGDEIQEDVSPGIQEQYTLLRKKLLDPKEATSQLMLLPFQVHGASAQDQQELFKPSSPGSYLTLTAHVARPFSRGYVHIQTSDPSDHPLIDPQYLSHPMDVEILCHQFQNLQALAKTEPIASKLVHCGRTIPPNLPSSPSLDTMRTLIKENLTTQYHPIGTCAMQPREKGGVVDSGLKVYGTSNLRIVDASVFPLHMRGNIQSTVYAVAEYASDIIRRDWDLSGP
jgi:choline dehydrogenase-like flavoprotein